MSAWRLIVRNTLVDREVVLYWITGQYRFLAKYSVTILKRTFAFSVLADQDDKKMAVIFGLYVWRQWIVTGYQCRDRPIRSCFSCPIRGCWMTFFIAGALPGTRNSEGIVERKHKDGLQESLRQHGHHEGRAEQWEGKCELQFGELNSLLILDNCKWRIKSDLEITVISNN